MSSHKYFFSLLSILVFIVGSGQTSTPAIDPMVAGWYEETSHYIVYSGSWTNTSNASASGGYMSYAYGTGMATMAFYGSGVALYGCEGPARGDRRICIDGDCYDSDWYAAGTTCFIGVVFDDLDFGTHVLTVETLGEAVDVDAVHVWGEETYSTSQAISAGTLDGSGAVYEIHRSADFGQMVIVSVLVFISAIMLVALFWKVAYARANE